MGKNKLSSGLINVVTYDTQSNISLNSGSALLMSLSGSGTVTIPGNLVVLSGISGSTAESASFALNADKIDNLDSTQLVLTSSFNSHTSSISSSLGDLSGSVATTTSDLSSSVGSLSSSIATTTLNLSSSVSSSIGGLSGSVATTTNNLSGRISTVEGNYATTGSNIFSGNQIITGSICATGNIVTTGQIVAQTINVQQVTSSIVYSCGSNIFGTDINNTQQFTGSLQVTGSTHYLMGNVGIGTNNPYSTLTVGSGDSTATISPGGSNTHLTIKTLGASGAFRVYTIGGSTGVLSTTESFRVNAGGNVGVGTLSPSYKFEVCAPGDSINIIGASSGDVATGFRIGRGACLGAQIYDNPQDNITTINTTGGLNLRTGGSGRLSISSTGISCFSCQVCAAGAVLSANLSGTNANFSSYISVGSLVVNDPGAAYYSYTNRIGGSTSINVNSLNVTTELGKFLSSGLSINSGGGATNNMYQISFGYKDASGVFASSAIAGIAESSTGYNTGAIIFATRSATTDTAPVERLRISSTGAATFSSSVTASGNITSLAASPLVASISCTSSNDAVVSARWTSGNGMEMRYNPDSAVGFIQNIYPAEVNQLYGDIQFRHSLGGTMTPRMIIKGHTGNVGINTILPNARLEIVPPNTNGNEGIFVNQLGSTQSTIRFKSAHSVMSDFRIGASILAGNAFEIYNVQCNRTHYMVNCLGFSKMSPDGQFVNGNNTTYHSMDSISDYVLYLYNRSASGHGMISNVTACNTTTHTFRGYSDPYGDMSIIYSNGTFGSRTNTYSSLVSDVRCKTEIYDSLSQWSDIKNLRVKNFKLIEDVENDPINAMKQIGFIAQEVEIVSPGLVFEAGSGCIGTHPWKNVKTSIIHIKAVKALQEAMCRIEILESCLGIN